MLRHFDEQLQKIFQRIAAMGTLAESMIELAVRGLLERNDSLFNQVYEKEKEVNALQIEIDEQVFRLTALSQPFASDARFLFMAGRIVTDVERIGDQAKNICQNATFVLGQPPHKPLEDLPTMASLVQKMVRDALNAVTNRDVGMAEEVLREEQRVDAMRDQIFRMLVSEISTEPEMVQRALSLILISRNLERIGDHATNIAEEAIYLVQGRDVRHQLSSLARGVAGSRSNRAGEPGRGGKSEE
jgi:phosphate transport system protein